MQRPCRQMACAALAALLASGWLAGAGETGFIRIDRAAALEAAAAVTAERYPDADEVLVSDRQYARYAADGTYVLWHEEYVKVLTEEGRRKRSTLSTHFTIPYQRGPQDCRIELVEIIKPDGTTVPIDIEAQSRLMVDPGSMAQNIYNPNDKVIRLNIPGLEVGDVLHALFFDRIVQPRMAGTWSDYITLEGERPIVERIIEIDAPAEMPLRSIALKAEIEGTVSHERSERNGRILYRWTVRGVPRMFPEPKMPSAPMVVQRLLVSTIPDWETVSRWYWEISAPHYTPTDAMREKVAALTAGVEETMDRIRALFRFVSQEVRYMGITVEATAPGYEPHDVRDTFEARHGVCRDKAALLVVMLRLAGIDAYPVLIHVGPRKDPEVPQPYFNHAVVAARPAPDRTVLMDPTDEATAELLPAYLNNKSYLVAHPEGEPLATSPISPAEHNLLYIDTEGAMDAAGVLRGAVTLRFEGINDNAYRGHFAESKAEERVRFVESLIRRAVPGAGVTGIRVTPEDPLETDEPLAVRASFEAQDALVADGDRVLLPLPVLGNRIGVANFILGDAGLETRRYPLLTRIACGVVETVNMRCDPGLGRVVSLPAAAAVEHPTFAWSLHTQATNGSLSYASDFRLKAVEFQPEDYQALKDGLETIERAGRQLPVLARGAAGPRPDAELEADVTYTVHDTAAWSMTRRVTKRILTYAGKKKHAEIKIDYNPAWESVAVTNVRVTAADGTVHRISDKEINLMDARWVGAAPRYPPARTLVASLPAVEVGSTVSYEVMHEVRDRPFFAAAEAFQGFDPVARKTLTIEAPAGLAIAAAGLHVQGGGAAQPADGGPGRLVRRWEMAGVAALDSEDMLPPLWGFSPTVLASAGAWSNYAARVDEVLRAAAADQPAAERRARTLTAGVDGPWERLRVIRDDVAVRVRAIGPGLAALPLSAVSPADRTLSDAYGNTTDRAVLLFAMLRAAGFRPRFVLASGTPDVPVLRERFERFPDPALFPAVLVRVGPGVPGLEPGRFVYLNDTDQYAAVGACSHEGRLGLVLPAGRIEAIAPARERALRTDVALRLEADGAAVLTRVQRYDGDRFGAVHKRFAEMSPEERDRYVQARVAEIAQSAERVGELETDFDGYPGVLSLTVRIPDFGIRNGDELYFALPASFDDLLKPRSTLRALPYYQSRPDRHELVQEISLPDGWEVVVAPRSWTCADVAGADVRVSVASGGGALRVRAAALERPAIGSAEQYGGLVRLARRLRHKSATLVLLRRRSNSHYGLFLFGRGDTRPSRIGENSRSGAGRDGCHAVRSLAGGQNENGWRRRGSP